MSQWWVDALKTGLLTCTICEMEKSVKEFTSNLYRCDTCMKIMREVPEDEEKNK